MMKDEQKDLDNEKNWDNYWGKQKKSGNKIYSFIAQLYRKFIIKRALNYFIKKCFKKNSELLHAGCGSGQVDTDITPLFSITALDISTRALEIYEKENKGRCKIVKGSIFNIPSKDSSFDGVYNLGVMEHFTKEEIRKILSEFNRVLKPKGKLVIFWPPEFGSSVIILKAVHFIINNILKENISLHPPEISRIRSKKQAIKIFNNAGFEVNEYYFGIRDIFTYVVIVAQKNNVNYA